MVDTKRRQACFMIAQFRPPVGRSVICALLVYGSPLRIATIRAIPVLREIWST